MNSLGPAMTYEQQKDISPSYQPPPASTVSHYAGTFASQISQLAEMCSRAEVHADRLSGGGAAGETKGQAPKAVPSGLVEQLSDAATEFGALLGRMERALNRIGDAL